MSSQQNPSQDEVKAEYEKLLATLPPEVQKIFRENEQKAKTRPPRPRLAEISSASLKSFVGEDLDIAELAAMAKFRSKGTLNAFSKSYAETNLNKFNDSSCRLAERFPLLRANLLRDHEEMFLPRLR